MVLRAVFLFGLIIYCSGFRSLFPEQNRLYTFNLKANVTTGTLTPINNGSYWTLEGKLSVQVYDDYGRARFRFGDLKTQITSTNQTSPSPDALELLQTPWEVGVCFSAIHVDDQPVWVTNVKRAISFNFLVAAPKTARAESTSIEEPCLYGNCLSIYSTYGNRTRKYSAVWSVRSRASTYEQKCEPLRPAEWRRQPPRVSHPDYLISAERDYYLDEKIGLQRMELKSSFQYKSREHILSVVTDLSLQYETSKPVQGTQKLNLIEKSLQYEAHTHSNPSNGIWNRTQIEMKKWTYDMLLKIAKKGIDADNIVRNATLIHNLDYIDLLNTMSQLNYQSLSKLFIDVLGTSYELETSRNIFLEILPYVRNEAAARLIKNLVTEQKSKIEDAILVSLLRKLPFNIVDYNRRLLEDLEIFSKLGPDFPQEIRHAGILSFATLVYKTMEVNFDQQYFDDIYDKYLRMYNYCPQYIDRLVWLQGLINIGKNGVNYLDEIYTDNKKDRHERLWAAMASLSIWKGASIENTLPILMNETEHIQLRIVALHAILSSRLDGRDFYNVHNYIVTCNNDQLKRFWFSTLKSLEGNRFYDRYKSASYFVPFLAAELPDPSVKQWATNNFIISQEPSLEGQGPSFQLMTVGGRFSGPPEMVFVEFTAGGGSTFKGALYIIAEGVTPNIFKRFQKFNKTLNFDNLLKILNEMKIQIVDPENVHIDIIIKAYDNAIYATHINQERFDSWNSQEVRKSIEDFVRFGSHINQQIVYYPTQMIKDFPTEIGTPLRLHSTTVSFTSIRGNLTAPSTDDITWRNDLHIRYQGSSTISLSTDGILPASAHTARIQQSLVVHLPIKFDVKLSEATRHLELKWTNPTQDGGIAMHSRTQIATITNDSRHVFTVSLKNKGLTNRHVLLFFDCENDISLFDGIQHLLDHNIFSSFHPTQFILNSLHLLTSPTTGSCGVILPMQLDTGHKLKMDIKVDNFNWDGHRVKIGMAFGVIYFKEYEDGRKINYFTTRGSVKMVNDGKNGDFELVFNEYNHVNRTNCFSNRHKNRSPFNIDFSNDQASYTVDLSNSYTQGNNYECFCDKNQTDSKDGVSKLSINYVVQPREERNRDILLNVSGEYVETFVLNNNLRILQNCDFKKIFDRVIYKDTFKDMFTNTASFKENNGEVLMTVQGSEYYDIRPDILSWLTPRYTALQFLKQFGLYYECRVNGKSDFSGKQLIIGECTDKPRFAVIQPDAKDSNVIIYSNENSIDFHSLIKMDSTNVNQSSVINEFHITRENDEIILRSKLTGVQVYHSPNETVILVPQPLMTSACGSCIN